MIVSMQIVVLPVERSPMISSRWPRPIGNHRVDRHDARLHRLADRAPADDPGRELFDGIRRVARDRALAVERRAERVDDASEQALADRDLQQLARAADLVAFLERRVVAEDDDADFGLVERQREAGDAVTEIDHLVQHHVRQPFDSGDAVADLADRPDALLREGRFRARRSELRCRAPGQPCLMTSSVRIPAPYRPDSIASSRARTLPS